MKIAFSHSKHLRLALQSAKATCVHEPRPVTLVGGAWIFGSGGRSPGSAVGPSSKLKSFIVFALGESPILRIVVSTPASTLVAYEASIN